MRKVLMLGAAAFAASALAGCMTPMQVAERECAGAPNSAVYDNCVQQVASANYAARVQAIQGMAQAYQHAAAAQRTSTMNCFTTYIGDTANTTCH
jgi:hypothetical protein